jgi:hypothetical protein
MSTGNSAAERERRGGRRQRHAVGGGRGRGKGEGEATKCAPAREPQLTSSSAAGQAAGEGVTCTAGGRQQHTPGGALAAQHSAAARAGALRPGPTPGAHVRWCLSGQRPACRTDGPQTAPPGAPPTGPGPDGSGGGGAAECMRSGSVWVLLWRPAGAAARPVGQAASRSQSNRRYSALRLADQCACPAGARARRPPLSLAARRGVPPHLGRDAARVGAVHELVCAAAPDVDCPDGARLLRRHQLRAEVEGLGVLARDLAAALVGLLKYGAPPRVARHRHAVGVAQLQVDAAAHRGLLNVAPRELLLGGRRAGQQHAAWRDGGAAGGGSARSRGRCRGANCAGGCCCRCSRGVAPAAAAAGAGSPTCCHSRDDLRPGAHGPRCQRHSAAGNASASLCRRPRRPQLRPAGIVADEARISWRPE